MRALLATLLTLHLALAALGTHVHTGAGGAEDCPVCVASGRGAAPNRSDPPAVGPREHPRTCTPLPPAAPPALGAPQGAIPGQSPPRA